MEQTILYPTLGTNLMKFKEVKSLIDSKILETGRMLISFDSELMESIVKRGLKKGNHEDDVDFMCDDKFPPVIWGEFVYHKDSKKWDEDFVYLTEQSWRKLQEIL